MHSRELVRRSVFDPTVLDGLVGDEIDRARAVAELIGRTRAQLDVGATAEELLWTLWSGTRWPARLRRSVELGGGTARRAHRDLDSICALFDAAARAEETRDRVGAREFLATLVAQQIPADTLAERGARGAAVRLLTAHRAKGLEWRLVVVAHVQQDGWPDLRRRSTLLGADRIGTDGLVPPTSARELLVEERRLFYVACTRAREQLVVTAVASPEDDGDQPSASWASSASPSRRSRDGRSVRCRSAAWSASCGAPLPTPRPARRCGRRRQGVWRDSPRRRPETGCSCRWPTPRRGGGPARPPGRCSRSATEDQPVPMSASLLDAISTCPTQWFLSREAGGITRSHQSANLGEIVHALAERVAKDELRVSADDAGVESLMVHVGAVWDRMEFRTPWARARELDRVRAALGRFLAWHHGNPRTVVGIEQDFRAVLDLPDGEQVRLTGYADRLELDADGRVVVVDLKTNRSKPTDKSIPTNVQLGLYQLAVLTFSRKAAEQLRDRVAARVGRTMSASIGSTFHSFAYGLIRRYAPAELYVGPLRLLSAPEQDVVLRELLQDHPESIRWPDALRHALGTRGFAREVHAVLSRAREKGLDGEALQHLGEAEGLPELVAAGAFLEQYLTILDGRGAVDYSDLIRRATIEATLHRDELRAEYAHVFVDEYQDTDTGQVALLQAIAGDGRDLVVVGDPHQSIYAFRGAEVRGILDFPTDFPRADGTPGRGGRAGYDPALRAADPHRRPAGRRADRAARAASPRARARRSWRRPLSRAGTARAGSWCAPSTATGARPSTSPTCCGGRTSRTASRGTRWRCWCGPAASPSRRCAGPSGPPACRSRSPATRCRSCATRPRCP